MKWYDLCYVTQDKLLSFHPNKCCTLLHEPSFVYQCIRTTCNVDMYRTKVTATLIISRPKEHTFRYYAAYIYIRLNFNSLLVSTETTAHAQIWPSISLISELLSDMKLLILNAGSYINICEIIYNS